MLQKVYEKLHFFQVQSLALSLLSNITAYPQPFICFTGHVTTLAGGSQGYKDGTGQDAKFHHTAGEMIKHFTL